MSENATKDVRNQGLDKFYTVEWCSKKCINKVFEMYDKNTFDLIVEPSAGNGSWHWIKSNINKGKLIRNFNNLDYSNSLNTARQNSMGRGELVKLYTDFINNLKNY